LLALFFYFYLIYNSGFKNIIWRISFLKESPFLDLALGIFPFLLFLTILWANSFVLLQASLEAKIKRKTYLFSQIRLNALILLPVFLFALLQDILKLLPFKGFENSGALSSLDLLFFMPFFILLMFFYPMIMKIFWGCYPLSQGLTRKKIDAYCRKAGLKTSDILIWPTFHGRTLTAGITGIVGRLRYLFITPGLLKVLNDDEIESVIAHEAGHVKMKHMCFYILFFLEFPLLMLLISGLLSIGLYGYADLLANHPFFNSYDTNLFSLGILLLLTAFILFYLRIFFGLLSRNFERQADLFSIKVVGHPLNLISALEKISYYGGHSKDTPNWHHYSIGERIKFLYDCLKNKDKIEAHQRKVRIITRLFMSIVILTVMLLCGFHHPQIKKTINLNLMEKQVQRVMADNPQSLELKMTLADILLEKKEYHRAEPVYQQIIQVSPDNVAALNNLAWLYATSEDAEIRDKKRALTLAQKAAELKKEPCILDTLAEAYFINGKSEEALQAIEAAIALQPDNLKYYLKQKQKFGKEIIQ
ncbi:MAG: M48 family metalloprotease, partial [Proteobacteria bacterium]|nr:M48 family metalloprotease [Pseudomonadota bacterium]